MQFHLIDHTPLPRTEVVLDFDDSENTFGSSTGGNQVRIWWNLDVAVRVRDEEYYQAIALA